MNWTRAGAWAGLAAAVVVTVGWVAGGAAQGGGYDWASQEISDLGALTAKHAWVWNLSDSLFGVLTCVFAAGLLGLVGGSRAGRVGVALVGIVGVGSVIDGLLREDCPLSTSKACQRLQEGPGLSWHHYAHDVESVIVAVATVAAPFVLAGAFRAARAPDSLRAWSRGAGAAVALSYAVYVGRYGDPGGGVAQRLALTVFLLWIVIVSLWMLRSAGARSAPR